jgi:hypothetical protein
MKITKLFIVGSIFLVSLNTFSQESGRMTMEELSDINRTMQQLSAVTLDARNFGLSRFKERRMSVQKTAMMEEAKLKKIDEKFKKFTERLEGITKKRQMDYVKYNEKCKNVN